jgi:hypothetical protein
VQRTSWRPASRRHRGRLTDDPRRGLHHLHAIDLAWIEPPPGDEVTEGSEERQMRSRSPPNRLPRLRSRPQPAAGSREYSSRSDGLHVPFRELARVVV